MQCFVQDVYTIIKDELILDQSGNDTEVCCIIVFMDVCGVYKLDTVKIKLSTHKTNHLTQLVLCLGM